MQRSDISASVKLFLRTNDSGQATGLGLGVVELCQRVERLGSLNRAAQDMGMAYSKAWRIVKNAEDALGIKLFIRKGASGSSLTPEARALVDIFRQVEEELAQKADEALYTAFEKCAQAGLFVSGDAVPIETQATPELIAQVRSIERKVVAKH